VKRLDGHTGEVRAVAFTPAGRVVSGGSDRTVRFWDPVGGECLAVAKARAPVYAVAAAPDGSAVAAAGRAPPRSPVNAVTLLDPATAAPVGRYELRTAGDVYTRDPDTLQLSRTRQPVPRSVWALAFTADGQFLVAAYRKPGAANIPAGAGGHWWRRVAPNDHGPLPHDDVYAVGCAPAGAALAATCQERVVLYDAPDRPAPRHEYPLQCAWAPGVAFVPPGEVAVVAAGSYLHFVGAAVRDRPRKVKTGLRAVAAVAAAPLGRTVVAGGAPAGVEVYDVATGARRSAYDFGVGGVHAVAFAPDGLTFALAGADGLAVCDAEAG
jgi:hypothetical protein